ncbi:MAG: penicillin-binding protein [Cyanobacteria bacterium SW_10_48_33]|nr:MAG: penicillin-binding protein [Cyanobacteria bacterium SW_10_48_33]
MSSSTIRRTKQEKSHSSKAAQFSKGVAKAAGGTILTVTMLSSSVVAGGLVGLAISFRNLPDVRMLRNYAPNQTSYIYDIEGKLLDRLHGEANREVVKLDQVAPELKRAVLAIEDSDFYAHRGINPPSVGRAFLANFQEGEVVEGASTITMQLVKNLFLSPERAYSRKLAEAVLAIRVEQIFSKDQILEMYLNNVYWGHNNYGAETAAKSYFRKSASELNLAEAAMMAGIIQSPEYYSPFQNYEETKERQAIVLNRMEQLGWITAAEEAAALKQPLWVGEPTTWKDSKLPYVTEAVVAELEKRFGSDQVIGGGLRIQTTVDSELQQIAKETVEEAHRRLRRQGLDKSQMALVAVDPRTHFVKAMVGGTDYEESQFNRVTQALRQPGSSFKPFVYYTAFASGKFTPSSTIVDAPVRYRSGTAERYYEPKNYSGEYAGKVSLRNALTNSRNVPAVKLGQKVGIENVIEVTRTLGIESPLRPVVSLPLGARGVKPLEMAGAYATFANNGWYSKPTMIVRVTDSEGNVVLNNQPDPKLVLNQWAVASLNSVLQNVIQQGTGAAAQIGRPAAGKTGTTDSNRDVWFIGYVPQLATAVWIGNDNYEPLVAGATGGRYAAPVWRNFMKQALTEVPVQNFPSPKSFQPPKPD